MRKTFILGLSLLIFSFVIINAASAEDKEFANRKGFLIGFGPMVGTETNHIKMVAGGLGFRIGYAFNEKISLYYDDSSLFTRRKIGGEMRTMMLLSGQAKTQVFLWNNFYANAGVGFSDARYNDRGAQMDTKMGFGFSTGAGYEFRMTKHFVLSPEISFGYHRIGGTNFYAPIGYLHLGWYL
ncbi:MAG: outer membrane beta-barrel protein [Pseudomonadota bacterium]